MCNTLVVLLVVCTTVWVPALPANPLKMITNRLPRMSVQVERLEPCPDPADTPIQFTNLVISQVGLNRFIISGQINITETLDRPILIVLEMYKCATKDDPNSCEYYFTFRKNKICDMLDSKEETWSYFTKGTDLPEACPFPPKVYNIRDAEMNLKDLRSIPIYSSHWRLINKAYMNEKLMFCLISEFTLQTTKG
ncbi:uncharacterized protein LOC124362385 [Homalodisca vitripennis]|uniref:uncharacterized protein LOC124362385 n=1 Tax=Homalodisca vitripennis TaxID=197043 RepID=UPI001EECE231|nr:uncharacterized protein LOC124362385 [Homalodisca vitripennis]